MMWNFLHYVENVYINVNFLMDQKKKLKQIIYKNI